MTEDLEPQTPPRPRQPLMPPGALGAWWRQGARAALFMRVDWRGLQNGPAILAALVLTLAVTSFVLQRLFMPGPASLYGPALQSGWQWTLVSIWICWWLVPSGTQGEPDSPAARAPSAAALFAMMSAQSFVLQLAIGLPFVAWLNLGDGGADRLGTVGAWIAWGLPLAWMVAAQALLAWRTGTLPTRPRALAVLLLASVIVLAPLTQPLRYWYPDRPAGANKGAEPLQLTQAMLEAQAQALTDTLAAVAPRRAGAIDLYAITFAPYASEDVFLRESRLVASVMEQRFGAAGRSVQLINHRDTVTQSPWATPLNLKRTIDRMAQQMDRDKDVLFIHLTSHGAHSGHLSAEFWPLAVDSLTPQALKGMLDAAGIRHRVISVSACFAGSWVEPLADADTLVMTASDADHTSYGCGRKSPLTFFGRAMYDEQLRNTWSFEAAHAEARRVIEQREKEAGKTDGYSNPQIRVGPAIREHLARFEAERRQAQPSP